MDPVTAKTLATIERFNEAFNRHDVDAIMALMTDDCVFEASAGPQVDGQRSEGKHAVRAAYAAVFEAFPDAHWANPRHFTAGNRAVSEWTFTGTQKDGKRVEVTGCDLFTFRDATYLMRGIAAEDYRSAMTRRSTRWGTVHLPAAAFRRLVRPFSEFLQPCEPRVLRLYADKVASGALVWDRIPTRAIGG